MTADRLQSIVLRLANSRPTRYWLHWNYPEPSPWLMALKVWTADGHRSRPSPTLSRELRSLGGTWDDDNAAWIFERTDDAGQPFRSTL
jgi:hypothetical protein